MACYPHALSSSLGIKSALYTAICVGNCSQLRHILHPLPSYNVTASDGFRLDWPVYSLA